jgi:dolichyl-diphosphooligosaccharide--protein glycosyltransferase
VIFPPADAQYHLRRAFYTWTNFPDVLLFDPYINYPGGAPISWPPLFDWALGSVAWLVASDGHGFEVVAAWAPPLLAALTALGIYCVARTAASHEVGLVACVFFALTPLSINYTRIGNVDHHAAVAMLGAWLLCIALAITAPDIDARRMRWLALGLFVTRLALLLTWHGSLLYLALFEATLLVVAVLNDRPALLRVQALTALAALVIVASLLAASPTPLGGDYSAIALSWLHVLAIAAVTFVSGGLWLVVARRPGTSKGSRAGLVALGGLSFLAVLLLFPGPREGLMPAFLFLTLGDEAGARTAEQAPLFALFGRLPNRPATFSWGFAVYLIPLAPAAAALLGRHRPTARVNPAASWILAAWGVFFGFLAIVQKRYGNDYMPTAAVLFALLCMGAAGPAASVRWVPKPWARGVRLSLALGLVVLLMVPALSVVHVPRALRSWAAVRGEAWPGQQSERSVAATLSRFAREIARVTPPTGSYLTPGEPPEYGILAHANLGHAIQFRGQRPTATDPFWEFIGRENWDLSSAFLAARDEQKALGLARRLRGRYVVSTPDAARASVVGRLHTNDGNALAGKPALRHFRLVTEAPTSGQSLSQMFGPGRSGVVPYKLFEIVPGAILEIAAPPGVVATARIVLQSPESRVFSYETSATASPNGVARLVLPYSTEPATPVRPRGAWQVSVGDDRFEQRVSEPAVREGRRLARQR